MSKEYLVAIEMHGEQWVEAESEEQAVEKAKDDPFHILQFTGDVTFAEVIEEADDE